VFGPLCFLGGIAGNFPLIEALVFHEMYGKQKQNLSPAVAQAIPIATAVPLVDAVPVYDPSCAVVVEIPHDDEAMTKEQRDAWYADSNNAVDADTPVAVAVAIPSAPPSDGGAYEDA
jgi:hypothetical protein